MNKYTQKLTPGQRETMMMIAKKEAQDMSDLVDRQARMIQLLITEAHRHFVYLKPIISEINRANTDKALNLFKYMQDAIDGMSRFSMEAAKYFPESKKYWEGIEESRDAFRIIMESVFGFGRDGKKIGESRRCILATNQEYELFAKWIKNHYKMENHMEVKKLEYVEDGLSDAERKWKLMPGWNAKPVVKYNEDGEWMRYKSISASAKETTLSEKKIRKAIESGETYKDWHWVTLEYWEEHKDEILKK